FLKRSQRRPARQGVLETLSRHKDYASYSSLLESPSLNAFPFEGFTCEEIPLRIHGETAHTDKLAGQPATLAKGIDNQRVVPRHNKNFLTRAIGHVEIPLLGVFRESEVPDRAAILCATHGLIGNQHFLNKLAVLLEDLNAIANLVADVNHAVFRNVNA